MWEPQFNTAIGTLLRTATIVVDSNARNSASTSMLEQIVRDSIDQANTSVH